MSTDLIWRDAPARRTGLVSEYISASRLNLWLRCPLAFRLRYIDGIKTPTSTARFVGKAVHAGLETWYRHRQLGLILPSDELRGRLLGAWDELAAAEEARFPSVDDEARCQQQSLDLVTAYLGQIPADEPRPLAVEATVEAPLVDPGTGEDLGIPLLGVMDLVLPDEVGPTIIDFKTAARGGAPLEITHEIQLSAYSYLYRKASGVAEGGLEIRSLIKTKTPRIESHRYPPRSDRHLRRLFAVSRAYLDDLDRGRFVFRPGMACSSCEFCHTHCRDWGG